VLGNAITPGGGSAEGPFSSEAELRELVDQAEAADLIEDDERQMIHSVFQLGDTIAREVMVPRTEMVYIERHKSLRQALSLGLRSGYSRIPVIGDDPDDVVGIAYVKDIMRRVLDEEDAERTARVDSAMRPAVFVPDSKDADDLLREMQASRTHMVIVVDEFGGTDGLVTIEDILEEIVGEIADEYDTEAPEVTDLPDGGWRISARMSLEHFADLADIELDGDVEGVETVSGLLARRLGLVPIPGARIVEQGYELTAESPEGRRKRIGAIVVRPLPTSTGPDPADEVQSAPARHSQEVT
jgi:CBS domain containing-hemolysin-like protein